MKYLFIFILFLVVISCSQNTKNEEYNFLVNNNIDWLLGDWARQNDGENKQTFEKWIKIEESKYKGTGFTIQLNDTIFKENLRLIKINGEWNYEVSGVNENVTLFGFILQTDTSFICENKLNDFPKRIEYIISNDTLTAIISDKDREISFIFKKVLN